jgi:photosystem II stability/assembly factor-like uncharacterized protein
VDFAHARTRNALPGSRRVNFESPVYFLPFFVVSFFVRLHGVCPKENWLPFGKKIRCLFVIAALAFLASVSRAQQWSHIGPEGGFVVSMVQNSAGVIFLGAPDGHVFASEDGAAQWELRGRVGSRTDGVVAQVVASPQGTLFAAVWYREAGAGGGVFRSDDGARTWFPSGLEGQAVRALEMTSSREGDLLAGTRTGVFHSTDNGKSWQRISPADNLELQNIDSLAVDPHDSSVIYAGTYHLPWRTTDGGAHWQVAGTGMIDDSDVMSLRVDSTNPSRIYLSACSGIYRSDDRGGSWLKLQGIPYGSRRTQAIVQDRESPDTLFAATTQGLWLTRDAGENWKRTTPADWVISSVLVLSAPAGSKRKVVLGTEGQGILVSEDGGETFSVSNTGFRHVVGRQLAGDPRKKGHLLLLSEQDGTQLQESFGAGDSWHLVPAAVADVRGKTEKLDFGSVGQIYGTSWGWLVQTKGGQLFLFDENARRWKERRIAWKAAPTVKQNSSSRKTAVIAATRVSVKGNVLAVSQQSFFIATSSGVGRCGVEGECEQLAAFAQSRAIQGFFVSVDEDQVLALQENKLGVSADRGRTAFWRDLPAGGGSARWIEVANGGASIFLGMDNGLYRSTDDGGSWVLLAHGLPAARMQSWLRADGKHYVAIQGGIYVSSDNGDSWTRLNRDAENSGFAGLVALPEGGIGVGSVSEGILAFGAAATH